MTAAATAALCLAPAAANEIADECRAYVDANGGDASGCDCLGAAAESDAALAEALKAIDTPEDLEAADESTKAAIAACYPNSEPQG
jgi:hypothetical protein